MKSNELNLKVEFEDTFDINNFSKSEQDIFFSSLLENLSKIYDKSEATIVSISSLRPRHNTSYT